MADICDVCSLPDPYNGTGDGIGSCDCPRGDCGAPDWSVFCTCPTEDDGPACWEPSPGGGVRCGLDVDHEGEHRYTIWNPLEEPGASGAESVSPAPPIPGHQPGPERPPTTATRRITAKPAINARPRNEDR